jgi:hypothetical protein
MVELTGDSKRDNQIIGLTRRSEWWIIEQYLEKIVKSSDQYAVGAPEELETIERVKQLLSKIKIEQN